MWSLGVSENGLSAPDGRFTGFMMIGLKSCFFSWTQWACRSPSPRPPSSFQIWPTDSAWPQLGLGPGWVFQWEHQAFPHLLLCFCYCFQRCTIMKTDNLDQLSMFDPNRSANLVGFHLNYHMPFLRIAREEKTKHLPISNINPTNLASVIWICRILCGWETVNLKFNG